MNSYDKLISLVDSPEVKTGTELPKIYLHKWLVLGQTEYVCNYGTLSDGHEKLTDAQKYAQSIKEAYYLAQNIKTQKAMAKRAMADILDADEALNSATTKSDLLRAEASKELAEAQLTTCLVTVEDQMRMLKFYLRRKEELEEVVNNKYPEGIEQAELDNWKAVAEYRMIKEKVPGLGRERLDNVPLPDLEKAKLGMAFNRIDAVGPLMVSKQDVLNKIPNEDPYKLEKLINKIEDQSLLEHN